MIRWCGAALVAAGISFALFMIVHPFGTVVGEVATRSSWVPAHSLHFFGAMFMLFGLLGLHARQGDETGNLGVAGIIIALIGTAMFVGTGMTTAFLWPVIAMNAPSFVTSEGAMFTGLSSGMTTATYVFLVVGFVLYGFATLKADIMPKRATWLLMVGVILFSAPVRPFGPAPWIARVVGALVFGLALVWLGRALRANPADSVG
jgi:hypothetical protein